MSSRRSPAPRPHGAAAARVARAPAAVALRYERKPEHAPEVVAKGRGEAAQRILALAAEHGIPVREDRDLLQLLSACDIGEEIPPELYGVVAELLHYLYRLNRERAPA